MLYYCLVKISLKKKTIAALMMMMCVPVVGLRVPSSCCGSPWPPNRLSSLGPLLRSCACSHSILISSFSQPVQKKKKMLHAVCGADLNNKNSRSGRVQSVSASPVDGQSPSSFVVESSLLPAQSPPSKPKLRRIVARGGACRRSPLQANRNCAVAWLVVAPASAHEHPD